MKLRIGTNQARGGRKKTINLFVGEIERRGDLHQILLLGRIVESAKARVDKIDLRIPCQDCLDACRQGEQVLAPHLDREAEQQKRIRGIAVDGDIHQGTKGT